MARGVNGPGSLPPMTRYCRNCWKLSGGTFFKTKQVQLPPTTTAAPFISHISISRSEHLPKHHTPPAASVQLESTHQSVLGFNYHLLVLVSGCSLHLKANLPPHYPRNSQQHWQSLSSLLSSLPTSTPSCRNGHVCRKPPKENCVAQPPAWCFGGNKKKNCRGKRGFDVLLRLRR